MRRIPVCLALFGLLAPVALAGQACLGSHATPGSVSLAGTAAVASSGDATFGPTVRGNLPGAMFAAAGYSRSDVQGPDLAGNGIDLRFGAEAVNDHGTSLCVRGAFEHGWVSGLPDGLSVDGQAIWGGGSLGRSFGDEVLVTPYGFLGVAAVDASASFVGTRIAQEEDVGARLAAGLGIGTDQLQARPHVTFITLEGADPVFGLDVLATF